MPLHRRLPKRGFSNTAFQLVLTEINVGDVQEAIDAGMLDAKNPVDVDGAGEGRRAAPLPRRREAARRRRDQDQGRIHGLARLEIGDRCGREGRRLGENPGAGEGSAGEPRGKNARFAAGLDKPKIFEAAPTPTKADAKQKADAKAEAKGAQDGQKPAKPAGKDAE